ncbi:MAG: alpha/beta hydrolase [Nitrospirae bacterium]|nr:MAG: alpha/beta hydrolase [Nitrospirota bacterium]
MSLLDRFFVYHPAPWIDRDWARVSGLPLQEVWFQAEDGTKLFGWYVENRATPVVLLWCHGNAGNIIHRLENLVELYRLGFSVFLFDYRGYGRSQGRPTEEGMYQDALAAYDYLATSRHVAPERLLLFGRSLGGAVAGHVAVRRQAAGLILEGAFPSVAAVARAHYFGLPVDWLLGAEFNLTDRLAVLSLPVLVIHGGRDEIIPAELGRQVFDAARAPKDFYLVPGADHNDLYVVGGRAYFQRLRQFAEQVVRVR